MLAAYQVNEAEVEEHAGGESEEVRLGGVDVAESNANDRADEGRQLSHHRVQRRAPERHARVEQNSKVAYKAIRLATHMEVILWRTDLVRDLVREDGDRRADADPL